jgi:integrase
MSCYSNKAIVDPVLFRVLCGTGLRISEALKLTISDVDTRAGTLRIRDSKNGAGRTIPITSRLIATLDAYLTAAHPSAEPSDTVFYSRAPGRQINQATIYMRFRGYLADAGIPHFTGGPHPHSLRHGFAVANLRRWAATGQDLAVMLPYLACYMGHYAGDPVKRAASDRVRRRRACACFNAGRSCDGRRWPAPRRPRAGRFRRLVGAA